MVLVTDRVASRAKLTRKKIGSSHRSTYFASSWKILTCFTMFTFQYIDTRISLWYITLSTSDINYLIQYIIPNIKMLEINWKKGAFIVKPIEDWLDARQLIAEQDKGYRLWPYDIIIRFFFFHENIITRFLLCRRGKGFQLLTINYTSHWVITLPCHIE